MLPAKDLHRVVRTAGKPVFAVSTNRTAWLGGADTVTVASQPEWHLWRRLRP